MKESIIVNNKDNIKMSYNDEDELSMNIEEKRD